MLAWLLGFFVATNMTTMHQTKTQAGYVQAWTDVVDASSPLLEPDFLHSQPT